MSDLGTVELGEPSRIHPTAILGERTGREVKLEPLRLGVHSHVRAFTTIYAGSKIGDYLETGHGVVIREENIIGDHFSIWNNSTVDYGCVVGDRVRVHCNVYISQFTIIEDDVFLAPGVMIANDHHPICTTHMRGPVLRRGARIGMNATILPEVEIGEDALVSAGAVVTHDVAPRAIVVGNPARVAGTVDKFTCPHRITRTGAGV